MNINRINRIDNNKGSLDSSVRFNKATLKDDSLRISAEARDKVNSKKIDEVKQRLDHHLKDGCIEKKILDHISDRIVNDLFPTIKKK